MIEIENVEIHGWRAAIRGMRNPLNSWGKSDTDMSILEEFADDPIVGEADATLMWRLRNLGSDHAKYLRFIDVTMDINAPWYWWKEFDTYKVGTVENSCSSMHTILKQPITEENFSIEYLTEESEMVAGIVINHLETLRKLALKETELGHTENAKNLWYNIIQLTPSSWMQRRTVKLNYEVLRRMYAARKNHKLQEWRGFCFDLVESILPMPFLITGDEDGFNGYEGYIAELNAWREDDD